MKSIYFDNGATSLYKPRCVKKAFLTALKNSSNPGRSGHKQSINNALKVFDVRNIVAKHFGLDNPENIIFTKNCTEALNIALLGTLQKLRGHIICSCFEHNSILRPLNELKNRGIIELSIVKSKNRISQNEIKKLIRVDTTMVCLTAISNVTGTENDISKIGKLCKERNILFLVDFAQGAGHIKLDMQKCNINYLAFSGHKGFLTPQGIGALCINCKAIPSPIIFGGTGTESQKLLQPTYPPESLESGTLAYPLIMSLGEGIKYVENNFDKQSQKLKYLTKYLYNKLQTIPKIKIYSQKNNPAGIVSFNISGLDSGLLCDYLDQKYNIATRGGLHCAPLSHKTFGTLKQGMVRVSMSSKNTKKQINLLLFALKNIKTE